VLCGEYPCQVGDDLWSMNDQELAAVVAKDTATAGIPLPAAPIAVHVRRLAQAYPVYLMGYERPLGVLDDWAASQPNMLVYGRQGLFAHDNTHHALFMAYSAVDCLTPGGFDQAKWSGYRDIFKTHVVED
jgi:protoporphyrinogen oxidase